MKNVLLFLLGCLPLLAQTAGPDVPEMALLGPVGSKTRHVSSYDRTGGNDDRLTGIKDGETRVLLDVKGAGVIRRIWVTMAPESDRLSRNDIILRMYWDGQTKASVVAPIGPFFGQGWEDSYRFSSAVLVAAPALGGSSLVSYFALPFAHGARIEIENQSGRTIDAFYFNIDYTELPALPPQAGRFHAWYHRELTPTLPDGENEWGLLGKRGNNLTGAGNYVIADIQGRGRFLGVNYYVHSPTPLWYGEGDEMLFIDGEAQPSYVGTGTEDYFNLAWSPREVFMHPYFGCARADSEFAWLGRFHNYRFHLADPICFEKSLRFTIEHGHNNVLTLDLATVAYWYQETAEGVPPIPDRAGRRPMPKITFQDLHRWRDAWRKQMGNDPRLWGNETAKPPAH